MKIMHVITDLSTGGAEVMLLKLLSVTNQERFQPVVVSLKGRGTLGNSIEALGIPVYTLGMEKTLLKGLSGLFRLISLVRKIQPNLIQGWMPHGNFMAQVAGFFLKQSTPVVWNIRQAIYDLSYESRNTAFLIQLCARISNRPSKIIYNSETAARQHESLGYKARKTRVIPNGFDTDKFTPSPEARNALRRELNLEPDAFLIGLVARFHPMKDHNTFIEAANILIQSGYTAHFVLSGKNIDINNSHLMDRIRSHNLDKFFHLLGDSRDSRQVIPGLNIVASSSYTESFPNIIGEAMSCEIPCAVTDVGDSAKVVGETGKTVPPKNPDSLALAWQQLMDLDVEARSKLGRLARERIQKCYNLTGIIQQYESLYETLVENKIR